MVDINSIEKRNWRAVYVKSRTEKKVLSALLAKGLEVYLPVVKVMRQWSDRKKLVELPLINGYVFVNSVSAENEIVQRTDGVVGFLREHGQIAIIRDEEIDRLRQFIELGYQLETFSEKKNYQEGSKVRITAGPLKNVEGYVVESKSGRSIEVYLNSIRQGIRAKLPEEILIEVF